MESFARCRSGWLLAGIVAVTGCVLAPRAVPVARNVSFAAHSEHRGIVFDRMQEAQSAVLVAANSLPFSGGPRFLLKDNDTTMAAVWLEDARATVRRGGDITAPPIGQVDASWEADAIRLTLRPTGDAGFHTGTFERVSGRVAPAALGQQAERIFDVRGVYRAQIVDENGAAVGWLRVRISSEDGRFYDGVLPAAVSGPLAAAAVARLETEVAAVQDHAENPYLGN